MGKKWTCISEGKYLEIEQCISLWSYIILFLYGDVRHMFNNILGYNYKEEENTNNNKEGNDKDTFSSFQEEEQHEKGNPINSYFSSSL